MQGIEPSQVARQRPFPSLHESAKYRKVEEYRQLPEGAGFMTIVTASEAQAILPRLLASVSQGEEVLITDGGLPVARLIRPAIERPAPSAQVQMPDADREDDEDDRPWRGVFAIESPGEPYAEGTLHLSAEPQLPGPQPADILWDRMDSLDE